MHVAHIVYDDSPRLIKFSPTLPHLSLTIFSYPYSDPIEYTVYYT